MVLELPLRIVGWVGCGTGERGGDTEEDTEVEDAKEPLRLVSKQSTRQ